MAAAEIIRLPARIRETTIRVINAMHPPVEGKEFKPDHRLAVARRNDGVRVPIGESIVAANVSKTMLAIPARKDVATPKVIRVSASFRLPRANCRNPANWMAMAKTRAMTRTERLYSIRPDTERLIRADLDSRRGVDAGENGRILPV